MFTYLLINLCSILIPFGCSFESRISFYKKWKYLFPSLCVTALPFLIWDAVFTHLGVWGFNPKYLTGLHVFNLPVEEILFFFAIPYACMFTYEVLNHFVRKDYLGKYTNAISVALIFLMACSALLFHDKLYTFYTSVFTLIFLMFQLLAWKKTYLGRAYFSYLIILIPFFMVNGLLTGSFLEEPVVWYDDAENLSIRLFTIPVEDTIYGLLLFLMNVSFYEWFKKQSNNN